MLARINENMQQFLQLRLVLFWQSNSLPRKSLFLSSCKQRCFKCSESCSFAQILKGANARSWEARASGSR